MSPFLCEEAQTDYCTYNSTFLIFQPTITRPKPPQTLYPFLYSQPLPNHHATSQSTEQSPNLNHPFAPFYDECHPPDKTDQADALNTVYL